MSLECPPRMVRIPAGDFVMGSDGGADNERPAHPVFLDDFYICPTVVTIAEYHRFVTETGHRPVGIYEWPSVVEPDFEETFTRLAMRYVWRDGEPPEGLDDHPVSLVQYADAVEYCRWLSHLSGRPFRLPTEAEWEKAARGGVEAALYPWGDQITPANANYLVDVSLKCRAGTRPVASYPANAYRLYDMAGNVWQWVSDWYEEGYYPKSERRDPQGPANGRMRVVRGGSWVNDNVSQLRCAHRHEVPPDTYSYSIGFRVACSA